MLSNGGCFIVEVDESNIFQLKISETEYNGGELLCDVATRLFVGGDLKFYAQMLGCTNTSGSWCMWC